MMKRNDKGRHKNSKLQHYLRNEEINWLNNLSGGERSLKKCVSCHLIESNFMGLFILC